MARYVSYLRVSTDKQGKSGLGLEAQREAVARYVGADLLAEYVEIESGRKNDRPKLLQALTHAKATNAVLVIAKLDRLARNVAFIANLMESGAEFVACDMPTANRLTIHILAAVAEHEREMISARTKAALAAAKARGMRLGCPNGAAHLHGRGNAEALAGKRARANGFAEGLKVMVDGLRAEGFASYAALAAELNRREVKAPRGGEWFPQSVKRLLERL